MRHSVLCVIALILLGCQSPKVHVFMETLSESRQAQVEQSLNEHHIAYEIASSRTPSSYSGARLNKFPGNENRALYDTLRELVQQLGFQSLDIQDFNQDKHSFSNGHVGLYLIDESKVRTVPDLMVAQHCDQSERPIVFNANYRWKTQDGQWRGDWRYYQPYLTLRYDSDDGYFEEQSFELHEGIELTPFGEKAKLTFVAMGHRRKAMPILNCDFVAVIMD
ncbi:hypothetical protein NI389_09090 [Pseudoalteromonas xiamenensis]|uniref:hypothetical protein n=1 Tax=Pseudoalteromonas xiamenensis TaxID=882626 RepID=UPI0027E59A71|nr:hypothetical protein [Pseudoalteromonas xiamenensis]WMN58426.1 hypothetical protein NI389_09090 [Pseudoalteromonas xiamenensis]